MSTKSRGGINRLAPRLLRAGLAIIFAYAAISSFVNPQDWLGYLPRFATNVFEGRALLHVFSVFELLLAIWFISGWYVKYAALLAAATLVGIVTFNPKLFAITFRDLALAFSALALYALESDK